MASVPPHQEDDPIRTRRSSDEIRQCGCPIGELGIKVAHDMNLHHAELWQWGLEHVELPTSETTAILDIGCGSGMLVKMISEQTQAARLCGLDHSSDMVMLSRKTCAELCNEGRAEFFTGSVSELPFADETFDLVTAFETIYFWPSIESDLREVWRVLQPGGTFLAVTESYDHPAFAERNQYCMDLAGGQTFTPKGITTLLETAGFKNINVDTIEEKNWMAVVAKK
ncbi:MAG: class I SAM-dependent methyltransferase [Planctomycetia bacterium]|jgi:ubiquinone/menaquinone biosynthesis C-methylase UbiE